MAVSSIQWRAHDGVPGDGSSGNAGPALTVVLSTDANPKHPLEVAAFDPATAEYLWFQFRMPPDYISGGTAKLLWMANAVTATSVVWAAKLAGITPTDADTPVEHAPAAASSVTTAINATEARRLIESSIALANLDSVAAGDLVFLVVYRDAANGADTCAVDAELLAVEFSYTS